MIFCRHKWIKQAETTTESAIEVATSALKGLGLTGNLSMPEQLCYADRKYIVVLSCEKCGKVKKTVETLK